MRSAVIALGCFLNGMVLLGDERVAAVVAWKEGNSVSVTRGKATTAAKLHEWLHAGDRVDAGAASRVIIVLSNGNRYRLGAGTSAVVGAKELHARAGKLEALSAIGTLPIAGTKVGDSSRPAAVRIRGQKITGLYPQAGNRVLSSKATLRFNAVPTATKYRIEVENDDGDAIFAVETPNGSVVVPEGVLVHGAHYVWRVKSVDNQGPLLRGEGEFEVLDLEREKAREALRSSVTSSGEADARLLLIAIDRQLGLDAEADVQLEQSKKDASTAVAASELKGSLSSQEIEK